VIRRRWVVERTFAWIVKNRRFCAMTNNSQPWPRPSSPSPPLQPSFGDGLDLTAPSQTRSQVDPPAPPLSPKTFRL
jgi:hypothetical protein